MNYYTVRARASDIFITIESTQKDDWTHFARQHVISYPDDCTYSILSVNPSGSVRDDTLCDDFDPDIVDSRLLNIEEFVDTATETELPDDVYYEIDCELDIEFFVSAANPEVARHKALAFLYGDTPSLAASMKQYRSKRKSQNPLEIH